MRNRRKYSSELARIISGVVVVYLAICILIDSEPGAAGAAKFIIGAVIGILGIFVVILAIKDITAKRKG